MRRLRASGEQRATRSLFFGWILVAIATFETRRVFDTQFSPAAMMIATVAVAAVAAMVWSLAWPLRLLLLTIATALTAFVVTFVDGRPRGFDLTEAIIDAPLHGFGQVAAAVWPSPSLPAGVAAFALLTSASAGAVADLALRRRVGASLFPPTLVLGVVALLSADGGPPSSWTIMAFVLTVVGLLRSAQPRSHSNVSRALTAVMVVIIAAAPIASAELTARDRYNPRSALAGREPADTGINPFGRVAQWRLLVDDPEMFRSDSAQPGRWRLVALPRFDGRDWLPADNYRVAGSLLRAADPDQASVVVDVTLAGLDAPWLPTPSGEPVRISRAVEVDSDLSSLLVERTDPVTVVPGRASTEVSGATYQITVQPVPEPAGTLTSGIAGDAEQMFVDDFQPPPDIVQIALDVTANAETDAERAEQLAKFLRENFVLDPDLPPGHSMAMLDAFLLSTKRGTDEQFVGAYAVLAASVGLPTRISVGFETRRDLGGAEVATVASASDAVAWPEVLFRDLGWVSFDPVPAEENQEIAGTGIGPTGPSVVLDSPAPPVSLPAQIEETEVGTTPIAPTARPTPAAVDSKISLLVVLSVAAGLLAIAIVYVAVVLGLKQRRLRRRHRLDDPRLRILGAFRSGVDVLVDLGAKVTPAQTDREAITVRDPALQHVTRRLAPVAQSATAAVYASELVLDDGHADDAWQDVQEFAHQAGRSVGRRRALRARLSTRSLRRGLPDT